MFCLEALVRRCSVKKVFLEISENSQEITCARVSSLIRLQVEKRFWHRSFPANFAEFLRTPFIIEHPWCLLLSAPVEKIYITNPYNNQNLKTIIRRCDNRIPNTMSSSVGNSNLFRGILILPLTTHPAPPNKLSDYIFYIYRGVLKTLSNLC